MGSKLSSEFTQPQLYDLFLEKVASFRDNSWHLVIFEGSPTDSLYSWCPDCVFALPHVKKFKAAYGGSVEFLQFKVGSREEWENTKTNPFKISFPYLTDLPTAILFRGQIDTMRVIAVEQNDLLYLCERSAEYEKQIQVGAWSPPKKHIILEKTR